MGRFSSALPKDARALIEGKLVPELQRALDARPELRDLSACCELRIGGEQTEVQVWSVSLDEGRSSVAVGAKERTDLIVELHWDDARALLEGSIEPKAALADGRLRVYGRMSLAFELLPLLLEALRD